MKTIRFQIVLYVALAVLFLNTALAFAYMAEPPEKDTFPRSQPASSCAVISARVDRIDIPTRRADYAILDQLPECGVVAGFNIIPLTGSLLDLGKQRYADFKLLQAERMSE